MAKCGYVRCVCRDCKRDQPVRKSEFLRASQPKCVSCGGMLDNVGRWFGGTKITSDFSPADIVYTGEASEFEIQSFVYQELKSLGLNVRGEVVAKGMLCRFDLVVFNKQNLAKVIIEVKKHESYKGNSKKQQKRYAAYGVEIVMVETMRKAKAFINEVKAGRAFLSIKLAELLQEPEPIPVA